MVDTTDENKKMYADLDAILQKEKDNTPATDEEKEAVLRQLNELANSSMDFDPDHLDSIIAFASNYGNNTLAESILKKATEQKDKAAQPETPAAENTPQPEQPTLLAAQFRNDISLINQPSYDVYKAYTNLKNKKNPTAEELAQLTDIEKQIKTILANVDPQQIDPDSAVSLQDYLDIANTSENDEATKNRYAELQKIVTEKLKEYDAENHMDEVSKLTPEQLRENENLWKQVVTDTHINNGTIKQTLNSVLENFSEEERSKILATLIRTAIFSLTDKAPDENGANVFQETLENAAAEFKALVNAEYLKQEALANFCEKNKISPQDMAAILANAEKGITLSDEEKSLKQQFEQHLAEHLSKFPNFDGPYKNKQILENATTSALGILINRTVTKECRHARLAKAPSISQRVAKLNNDFAKKHPKIYEGIKKSAISIAISTTLGPVGLVGYSAFNTFKAIRKSYKQYKEKEGGNFKGFLKHLFKRENRHELIGLAGQIAATAIGSYFTFGGGLTEALAHSGGILGHMTGHITNHAATAAVNATGIFSPRRLAMYTSSLAFGTVKGLNAWSNKRHARKQLTALLQENGVTPNKDMLKKLEKCGSKEEFTAFLKEMAPNISSEQVDKAYKFADLANKSSARKEFALALGGAAIGVAAAEAFATWHDGSAQEATQETSSPETAHHGDGQSVTDSENSSGKSPEDAAAKALEEQHATTEAMWNDETNAAHRLESFGIDAKNANEMLRDMGVIKEGDNHFYRQHELDRLVNGANLTDEQRNQIQDWANDRDARVHNLKVWQAEHPSHSSHSVHTSHSGHVSNESPEQTATETTEKTETTETTEATKPAEEKTSAETQTSEEIVEKQKYHVQGRIDKLKGLQGNVEATNPIEAAQVFHQSQNIKLQHSSELTITDENGDRTILKNKIGNRTETTKITSYDGEEKSSYQKTKFYKTGDAKGSSRTIIKADLDGDGKADKIVTTRSADGQSVTMTKYSADHSRTLELKDADGILSTNEMQAKGDSRSHANAVLKDDYKKFSRTYRGKDYD